MTQRPKRAVQTTIRIDLDVYKALEARRQSFKETHSAILKRILEEKPAVTPMLLALPKDGERQ